MKLMTILGTRPEIIRLARIIPWLDHLCEHTLVHTGQNFEPSLSDVFFEELGLREPDFYIGVRDTAFAKQIGHILHGVGALLERVQPDKVLILGDTNSALSAIVAARMGIPVYHLEAGNRCYDDRVPEEINRRIIDHCSTVLMPYTQRSAENLVREGIERQKIYVVGNPINEVLRAYDSRISNSSILSQLGVKPLKFFLATLHRAENVDDPERLENLLLGLCLIADIYELPVIVSLHPHTASRIKEVPSQHVRLVEPMGFFDFVALEREALCVLTDSGTVQEECCIQRVPNVTLRDTTERPETIEVGSNILTGMEPEDILQAVNVVRGLHNWTPPPEYLIENVSDTVVRIVMGRKGSL